MSTFAGPIALARGIASYLPGLDRAAYSTIGTASARYCYSVWLRHLEKMREYGLDANPDVVAEIGPGDSLGVGISALLCGATKYYALDVVEHTDASRNAEMLDELYLMFSGHERIPDEGEFPGVEPCLLSYDFPDEVLTEKRLSTTLTPARKGAIRDALFTECSAQSQIQISYIVPWTTDGGLEEGSLDMIISQATLEHVEDIETAYRAFYRWLKSGGLMSHQIDFRCHGLASEWNGHWTYSDLTWKAIKGRRPFLINRYPHSVHIDLMREAGFEIVADEKVKEQSKVRIEELTRRFGNITQDDLTTKVAHILARKV